MNGVYGFLSRSLACLAVALVILSVLAMPAQGVRANDPSPPPDGQNSCEFFYPIEFCPSYNCLTPQGHYAGYKCSYSCGC
jgi:hypothetical protein